MTTLAHIEAKLATLIADANDLAAEVATLAHEDTCPECGGTGRRDCTGPDGWTSVRCPDCRGTGKRARSFSDLDILLRSSERTRCASCGGQTGSYDGTGQWYECGLCDGTGYKEGVVR